ncbi:MAG: hypothetical protein H6721_04855 [Sandaracinus sp.]|nr:hypothetical protein [Sandaracinus sp.]MCB9631457.1 hypothetical protein [Sandaracinus sp.]
MDPSPPRGPDVPAGCDFGGRDLVGDDPWPPRSGDRETVRAGSFTDEYLYDATGAFKVGLRREWGSSVVFFGESGDLPGMNLRNTIDADDTGREAQVALYDPDREVQGCAWNASCARVDGCPLQIRYLGWNPVQGGNRCNVGSPTDRITATYGSLVAQTVPLQWNPDWDARECSADSCGGDSARRSDVRLTQTLRFVAPRVASLRYTVENLVDVAHAATLQEMPTLYTANGKRGRPDLWRLMDPNGTQIPIDTPSGSDGFFYENFSASGPWVALMNDDLSYGVAILYENGLRDFQGWQKRDLPFNNVRSRIVFGLPARGVVHARAYLIVGSFDQIRTEAERLLRTTPAFGVLDFPGEASSSGRVRVQGWALDNRGVASIEVRVNDGPAVAMRYGDGRPDVCAVWPGYPRCPNVGYSGEIDLGAASSCPKLVRVEAVDTDENRRVIAERLVTVR